MDQEDSVVSAVVPKERVSRKEEEVRKRQRGTGSIELVRRYRGMLLARRVVAYRECIVCWSGR